MYPPIISVSIIFNILTISECVVFTHFSIQVNMCYINNAHYHLSRYIQ